MKILRLTFTIHIKRETFCQIIKNLFKKKKVVIKESLNNYSYK